MLDAGEACDDGNTTADDGCSTLCGVEPGWTCPPPGDTCFNDCGDGALQADEGEECDDGNLTNGDGCSEICAIDLGWECPTPGAPCNVDCGDGLLTGAETCDDGNETAGDGCSDTCVLEDGWACPIPGDACDEVCGDSMLAGDETCDDGNAETGDGCSDVCVIELGWSCTTLGEPCEEICGDSMLAGDETCDDGNIEAGDGCSDVCALEDGWACPAPGDACDEVCGDGLLVGSEACDDGNTDPFDGCSPICTIEVCPEETPLTVGASATGNTCDKENDPAPDCIAGNAFDVAYAFTAPYTGTFTFDTFTDTPSYDTALYARPGCGEEAVLACNDDTTNPFSGLLSEITLDLVAGESVVIYVSGFGTACGDYVLNVAGRGCGDGVVDEDRGETCDDGNGAAGDGCSDVCEIEVGWECLTAGDPCTPLFVCGDGAVEVGETCDDGNTESYDGCSAACQLEICPTLDEVTGVGEGLVVGNSCDAGDNDVAATCGSTNTGGDFAVVYTAGDDGLYTFGTDNETRDYDTAIYARDACGGTELACNDDTDGSLGSAIELELLADETVVIYVTGFSSACGEFALDVSFVGCGDGVLEEGRGETCDDGNADAGDGCNDLCGIEEGWECAIAGEPCVPLFVCGDGEVETGETCDDGNTEPYDGCSSTCGLEVCPTLDEVTGVGEALASGDSCGAGDNDAPATCGGTNTGGDYAVAYTSGLAGLYTFSTVNDGLGFDTAIYARDACGGTELACNDDASGTLGSTISLELGAEETIVVYVSGFAGSCGEFALDTSFVGCGDTVVDGDRGETCDDGNIDVGDGCSDVCVLEDGWTCDEGGCSEICGDGLVIGAEACDDANLDAGDGCSDACEVEDGWICLDGPCLAVCGDGMTVGAEACDDGNTDAGDGCSDTCDLEIGWFCEFDDGLGHFVCAEVCGDGIVTDGETCDDANTDAGDGCAEDCQVEDGWSCDHVDDGPSECTAECGDGLVLGDETCDDANLDDGDGCSASCEVEEGWECFDTAGESSECAPICGDGFILGDEECDDANLDDDDGCSSLCEIEDGWSCEGEPSDCFEDERCGDGMLGGIEECDDANLDDDDGCSSLCEIEDGWECVNPPDAPSECTELPLDTDGDGVADDLDNCPDVENPLQEDADDDGIGDACDEPEVDDADGDGVADDLDNCPDVENPLQEDADDDGVGDACEDPVDDVVARITGGGPNCTVAPDPGSPLAPGLLLGVAFLLLRRRRRC